MSLRLSATQLLDDVQRGGSLNSLFTLAQNDVAIHERPYFRELVFGSLRLWPLYKGITRQLLDKPLKSKDASLEALLILAMYELDECATPAHASVSLAVDVCEHLKKPWAASLINGCLRRYQRDQAALRSSLGDSERAALPGWLFKLIKKHYPDQGTVIGIAGQHKPPMTLRVNTQKMQPADYLACLEEQDIAAHRVGLCGITLETPLPVSQIPLFFEGVVSVQDASAQLAAHLCHVTEGLRVLDVCSAPGGKACHLAELGADVVALDISEQRLEKVRENADRLDVILTAEACDGLNIPRERFNEDFDLVLVDAPCSATGVLRRNPDVKLIRTRADIAQFAEQQLALLHSAWRFVKSGGRLLYATCSLLPEENEDVVTRFLDNAEDATAAALATAVGIPKTVGRQTLPSESGGDGLYYCLLEKSG